MLDKFSFIVMLFVTEGDKMIVRTLKDVCSMFFIGNFDHFTPAQMRNNLSKAVHKFSYCGVWADVRPAKVGRTTDIWTICLTHSLVGVKVRSARKRGESRVTHREVPYDVAEALGMLPNGSLTTSWNEITHICLKHDKYLKDGFIERVSQTQGRIYLTISVPRDVLAPCFVCGSIIEGSQVEICAPPVRLPCLDTDIRDAIVFVETAVENAIIRND